MFGPYQRTPFSKLLTKAIRYGQVFSGSVGPVGSMCCPGCPDGLTPKPFEGGLMDFKGKWFRESYEKGMLRCFKFCGFPYWVLNPPKIMGKVHQNEW